IIQLINNGKVERIAHGLYQQISEDKDEVQEYDTFKFIKVSARTQGNTCICLWSALDFYGLTEEFIEKAWVYIPYTKKISDSDARPVRKRNLDWSTGVVAQKGFNITSVERTLVDCFLSKKQVSLKDSIECTKKALLDKKTSIKKIINMAKKMDVFNRLRPYLEIAV
ncbi:hypothetical protein HON22_00305, partial [Candidatus Peregrinibacteria bacterium]|nr:hypothetical protein [Candidatus Peregrinibacteria bacterium]